MSAPRLRRDPVEIAKAYSEASSLREFCRRLRMSFNPDGARYLCAGVGLEYPAPHWGERAPVLPPFIEAEGQPEISDEEIARLCEQRGIAVMRSPLREDREHDIEVPSFDGQGSFRIGVVTDTHGGSRYQQLTFLRAAYEYFEREGITDVLHAGDWTAGSVHMHPGMVYETFAQGADQQAEYVCESYPRGDGITTHGISGNHDHAHLKSGGVNVVQRIARDRGDINYLGMSGAYLTINGIRFYIHHPSGGVAYARSYKLQKQIEQFSPENKPKVLITGHLHVTAVLESYRNVYAFIGGCFEAQTPYLVEKGLHPEIGFSTLEVAYDDEGAVRFRKEWIPCYVPREHDYHLPRSIVVPREVAS